MDQARLAMTLQRSAAGGALMRQGSVGASGESKERSWGGEEYEVMTTFIGEREMSKVRVKLRFQGDTRGMVSCSAFPLRANMRI
jgi:hypothetical protein